MSPDIANSLLEDKSHPLETSVLKVTSLRWIGLGGGGQSEPSFARQEAANFLSLSSRLTPATPRAQKDADGPAIYYGFSKILRKPGKMKAKQEKGWPNPVRTS